MKNRECISSNSADDRGFHKLDEIDNIGIRGFTTRKQKIPATKCYFQGGLNLGPLIPSLTLSFLS